MISFERRKAIGKEKNRKVFFFIFILDSVQ